MASAQQSMAVVVTPMGLFLQQPSLQLPVTAPVLGPQMLPGMPSPMGGAAGVAGATSGLLLAAVQSLYRDRLEPYGRILRKRLSEISQAAGQGVVEINTKELRAQCEACPWLEVKDTCPVNGGADWAVLLPGVPPTFVNIYSPEDPYPADMWTAAAAYFSGPAGRTLSLPGGRYACAQVLLSRRLPFLAGRTLGEICHIVQLSISQKKLLGYQNGAVVPYARSQSMVKERCAERCRPVTAGRRNRIATWDMLRTCVQEMINRLEPGEDLIPLSNIKRTFRSQFHVELSETALGYAKLSELLQDERLHDLCRVCLQGHGYALLPMRRPSTTTDDDDDVPGGRGAGGEGAAGGAAVGAPPLQQRTPRPRARTIALAPLCVEEIEASYDDNVQSASPVGRQAPLPKLLGNFNNRRASAGGGGGSPPKGGAAAAASLKPPAAAPSGTLSPAAAGAGAGAGGWSPKPLTPSTLGSLGFKIHNTFIHAALPPPTPVRGAGGAARRRSSSAPRDI